MKIFKAFLSVCKTVVALPSYLLPAKWLRKMNRDQRRIFNLAVTAIVIVVGTWSISSLLAPEKSDAAWFNDNWLYRQTVPVSNAGSTITNAQIPITFDTATLISAGKMKSDCSDIRVTNSNGKLLNHWVHQCNSATTKIYTWSDLPSGSVDLLLYYGNPTAKDKEVTTGTTTFPGISCKSILDHGDGSANQQYTIDPNAGSGADAFSAYCDMTTDNGGWTIVTSQNGTTSQQGLTSNNEVAGDPFSNASHNISTQKKQDISLVSSESIIKRSNGLWLKANDPLFDGNLTTANQHPHYSPITITANDGTQVTDAVLGYSNYNNGGGGDFGIVNATGFDHHSTSYYHLNSGCQRSYFYKYGTTYNVNTAVGSWAVTTSCSNNSTAMGPWYAGMRGTISPTIANVTVSTPTNEEKAEGPIAYWSMDEGAGGTVNDSTQNGNNGTISGATWQHKSMCLKGSCLYFDGTNDQVTFGDINNVPLTGDLTISFWIKPTNLAKGRQNPLGKAYGGEFDFTLETSGSLSYYHGAAGGDASPYTQLGSSAISENQWNHIVVTRDTSARTVTYYINGIQNTSSTYTSSYDPSDSTRLLRFGYEYAGFFQGYLDEVKIYATAKTQEQIRTDFNNGAAAVLGAKDANLNDGLVGYWKLDEDSTATASAQDSSGNGNTGTAAETTSTSGKYGNGRDFDGVNDYINIPDSTNLSPTTAVTLSTWVYGPLSTQIPAAGIAGKDTSSGISNGPYQLYISSAGTVTFIITNSSNGANTVDASSLQDNTWYNITGTYDGQTMRVYINGVLQASSSVQGNIADTTGTFKIGQQKAGFNRWFDGIIDETRVYNRALSPSEVTQLYNYAPPPVAYYDFEEKSGATLYDKSGTGNDSTSFTGTPTWTAGKYGGALSFDTATTDGVVIPGSASLNYNDYTLGFWIKLNNDADSTYRQILTRDPSGSDRAPGIWRNPNELSFHWRQYPSNTGPADIGPTGINSNFSADQWYYVTGVKDGTSWDFYVNGKKVEATQTVSDPMTNDAGGNLYIGKSAGYSSAGFTIDEVKLYNYPRTTSQIIEDMNASHPIGGSPVGSQALYLKLDEGTGTTANDESTNNSNGTISGCTWIKTAKFGKGLDCSGGSGYISLGNPTALQSTDFTMSTWIKTGTINAGGGYNNMIMGKETYSGDGFRYGLNGSGIPVFWTTQSGGTLSITATRDIDDGNWHHLVVTYDSATSTGTFYIDGKSAGSSTGTFIPNTSASFVINGGAGGTTRSNSSYDEFKYYTTALTAQQVLIDYNSGQSLQFGAFGTDASGNPSNSSDRAYCPPGDTTATCGPIAEWQFDERQGATANDTSGNGNSGSITGATWTKGKVGNALSFDGSGDNVNIGDLASIEATTVTFSAWVKFNDLSSDSDIITKGVHTQNQPLVIWRDENVGAGSDVGNTDTLSVLVYDGTTQNWYAAPSNSLNDTNWHFITVSLVPGSEIKIYIDGQLVRTGSMTNTGIQNTTSALRIGSDVNGGTVMNGVIDQVQIFNYALSASQVAWNYNRGAPVAYYDFDECQGSTLHSFTKPYNSALDGTITIGATGSQSSVGTCQTAGTAWGNGASGKINYSLSFDGTDDYLEIPQPLIQTAPNLFTVSGWIKPGAQDSFFITPNSTGIDQFIRYDSTNQRISITTAQATDTNQVATYTSVGSVPLNTWTHYAISVNYRTVKLYINGKLNNQATVGYDISGWSGAWRIGQRGNSTFWYLGQMDDLQIFNYELTANQIKTIMNQGAIKFGP